MMHNARFPLWALLLGVMLLLGGCASLQTQFDHEAELRAARGEPSRVWENDDGTRTLEYATQPRGETCWMYTVDQTGRVVEQHDALDHRNLSNVQVGMTKDEVTRLLGAHRTVERFPRMEEEVWDWNVRNEYPNMIATLFNVHFVDDKVARTSFSYIYPNAFDGWAFGAPFGPRWGMWAGYGGPWGHPWGPYGSSFGWYGRYGWW